MMTESTDSKSTDQEEKFRREILKKVEHNVNYCYNCNRCVNVCPLAKLNIFSPRRLINDLAFLSNCFERTAEEIAQLYKYR